MELSYLLVKNCTSYRLIEGKKFESYKCFLWIVPVRLRSGGGTGNLTFVARCSKSASALLTDDIRLPF